MHPAPTRGMSKQHPVSLIVIGLTLWSMTHPGAWAFQQLNAWAPHQQAQPLASLAGLAPQYGAPQQAVASAQPQAADLENQVNALSAQLAAANRQLALFQQQLSIVRQQQQQQQQPAPQPQEIQQQQPQSPVNMPYGSVQQPQQQLYAGGLDPAVLQQQQRQQQLQLQLQQQQQLQMQLQHQQQQLQQQQQQQPQQPQQQPQDQSGPVSTLVNSGESGAELANDPRLAGQPEQVFFSPQRNTQQHQSSLPGVSYNNGATSTTVSPPALEQPTLAMPATQPQHQQPQQQQPQPQQQPSPSAARNDDKFSIGLGVLSPGYTQKFGNTALDFNQDKDGYSFTLSNNGHSNQPPPLPQQQKPAGSAQQATK